MSHSYTNLLFHLVFSTKYRQPLIQTAWQPQLHQYLGGIVQSLEGTPLEIGGIADHVHLLISIHQKHCLMNVLRDLKANSSKWVNESAFLETRFEWQRGYGAFSVSQSQMGKVQRYIQKQETHHQRHSYSDEFLALLNAHQISYDERFVFD
ncbi:MAG: IS200/IS605 family transposase [Blastocatellia bacterium]|nr:IS200/IS605 family transposase [Blastocatellia bacterium]